MAVRRDLREACVREAMKIIEKRGLENLSLREVARRLRVSHQAPYFHFADKEHIVAEIVRRGYENFRRYLLEGSAAENPNEALGGLGRAYIRFALENPLYYRLMFTSPLPDLRKHVELRDLGASTFAILKDRLARVADAHGLDINIDSEAMFIWSEVHGLALILQMNHAAELQLMPGEREKHIHYALQRIGDLLFTNPRRR